jgi:IclR family acetate operon transcriptional repressor
MEIVAAGPARTRRTVSPNDRDGAQVAGARSGSQSLERAIAVLDCLSRADRALGVSRVAEETGLKVSTAHRLMRALRDSGLLGQDERTERYHLGPALVAMGRRAEGYLGFDRLEPDLRELSERTGESVNVGTRVGAEVLVAMHLPSSRSLRFDQPVGSRIPLHASAMGKALLAFSDDAAAEVAALGDLDRFTDTTITSTPALLDDLAVIRRRGWAVNDGERDPGVRTIGVPLLRADGRPFAAVAVQGPAVRIPDGRVAELAADLVRTAARLSQLP